MQIKRGHLYVVDFNPRVRTKPGKLRPALVMQSNLVNEASPHYARVLVHNAG
jgi:mRNA-degrading endonuclease toxin of MazEF toxin-antitoxin module